MKRSKITGIIGTVLVHLVVLALLLLITLSMPPKEEEGGVPVMLGNTQTAQGDADPYQMTEVDLLNPQEIPEAQPESTEPDPERLVITQEDEPSIKVKKEKPKPEKSKEKKTTGRYP